MQNKMRRDKQIKLYRVKLVFTFESEIWIIRTRTKQAAKTENTDNKVLGELKQEQ
jgi:hypothetical protein